MKQRMVDEHLWIEKVAIGYMKAVLSEYTLGNIGYEKHIKQFIKIVDDMLKLHFKFEEDEVFPLFPRDKKIKEYIDEHEGVSRLIGEISAGDLDAIKKLIELVEHHKDQEDDYIISKLEKMP
jgi:hypothetical protein